MFDNTITLYNYDKFNVNYYYTVFRNVEVQEQQRSEPDDTHYGSYNNIYERALDNALLIIKYQLSNGIKRVAGVEKTFSNPKEWNKLEDKTNTFTFQTDSDFFIVGENEDIKNYEELKNSKDRVYKIYLYNDYEYDLTHWEVYGS